MKKNELVHVHSLLAQVGENYVSQGIATRADFEEYDRLGVTPMSLQAPRAAHERAVLVLARILGELSEEQPAPGARALH